MQGYSDHLPIYQQLTEFYRHKIERQELKPGSKLDSISRIMVRHSVSRETAKLVIRKLVEQGLVFSVQGKGTFVSQITELKPEWAVLIPFFSSNMEQLIIELTRVARSYNRRLRYFLHYNNPDVEIRLMGELLRNGNEGIIVVPNYDERLTAVYYKRIVTGRSKLVLADNTMAGSFFNYVIQSYDLGVKRAFNYLTKNGEGNYLLVGNDTWQGQNLVIELVENTFKINLLESFPGRKLYACSGLQEVDESYLRDRQIRGILVMQDSDAVRLAGRISDWGLKIPEDVSLVCYGNTEILQYYHPSITAVECNYPRMADQIGKYISDEDISSGRQMVISPDLIIRET